jgi:hypothetical protein
MSEFKKTSRNYLEVLQERAKKSRAHKSYQLLGLELAAMLRDLKHKSLYMRLSKMYDNSELMSLAKSVAGRKDIKNKGAYFMKVFKGAKIIKITDK